MFKRRFLLLALPVVLLLAAAVAVWLVRPKKAVVTVEVSGKTGLAVKGTGEVDGSTQELTGVAPTQFVLEGYRVTFSLTSPEDAGEFRAKASINGVVYGSMGSGSPPKNGVRGWVKSGWGWSSPDHWIEPFAKDGEPAWISPPPP
jgi:hypothetical protein